MRSTVYSLNGKILVKTTDSKWLAKPTEVVIGNTIWMLNDLDIDDGGTGIYHNDGKVFYTQAAAQRIANTLDGWNLPNYSQMLIMKDNPVKLGLNHTAGKYDGSQSRFVWVGSVGAYGTGSGSGNFIDCLIYEVPNGTSVTNITENDACTYRLVKAVQ